jgi:hypothetical protein
MSDAAMDDFLLLFTESSEKPQADSVEEQSTCSIFGVFFLKN